MVTRISPPFSSYKICEVWLEFSWRSDSRSRGMPDEPRVQPHRLASKVRQATMVAKDDVATGLSSSGTAHSFALHAPQSTFAQTRDGGEAQLDAVQPSRAFELHAIYLARFEHLE